MSAMTAIIVVEVDVGGFFLLQWLRDLGLTNNAASGSCFSLTCEEVERLSDDRIFTREILEERVLFEAADARIVSCETIDSAAGWVSVRVLYTFPYFSQGVELFASWCCAFFTNDAILLDDEFVVNFSGKASEVGHDEWGMVAHLSELDISNFKLTESVDVLVAPNRVVLDQGVRVLLPLVVPASLGIYYRFCRFFILLLSFVSDDIAPNVSCLYNLGLEAIAVVASVTTVTTLVTTVTIRRTVAAIVVAIAAITRAV